MLIEEEEVSKDVEAAETLLIMKSSKPTREEYRRLRLRMLNHAEWRRSFRRNESSSSTTIATGSSTVDMESMHKEEDLNDTRNLHNLPPRFPLKERKSKKAKGSTEPFKSQVRNPTPEWLIRLMREKNDGDEEDNSKKIIDKALTKTDVVANNNRLSIPISQIVELDFLNHAEELIIENDANRLPKVGVNAILLATYRTEVKEYIMRLKLWMMGDCPVYNLVTNWNQVVKDFSLESKDQISLWSFRSEDQLYFVIVPFSAE
ncbi:PREDICTED: LOW QUALITY PROTEIN: B3 domain-containing protein At2g24670-like [Camelina sativa]|uniref:LOW QUALITY PROTEIN: B3 domain-containing protein At2g24670-like n=1 Tax=Camelina sativa TaxID=90675 RepID=A0ABM0TUE3_CAMSA|nr:PREDICTED: LOW QUALITY PROTEIN: B3 domain-containing protein At2g24670-like [Camelina sativa]